MRGMRAEGSFMASGYLVTSGMTAGSLPSRMAWQNEVSWRTLAPSWTSTGTEVSTTSRCWVVPSRRLRKATLRSSDFFAVTSRSAICWSAAERFLRINCLLSSGTVIDRPGRELERPHPMGEGRTQPRGWLRRTTPVERYRAHEHPVVRPRPGADLQGSDAGREHRRERRAGAARGAVRLPPGLVRRAPQHADDRLLGDQRADRARRRAHVGHPAGRRRRHAPQPLTADHRRAVRHPRGRPPGPDRPGAGSRAGLGPEHDVRAAPEPELR